jgi:hypothetical protein
MPGTAVAGDVHMPMEASGNSRKIDTELGNHGGAPQTTERCF